MHLTNILQKGVKSKIIMVLMRSTGSSHQIRSFRERNADKKEFIYFDPYIERECVYKEERKIKSIKRPLTISPSKNEHTYGIIPEELLKYDVPQRQPAKTKKGK